MANNNVQVRQMFLIALAVFYTIILFTSHLGNIEGFQANVLNNWGVWALPFGLIIWMLLTAETIGSNNLYDNIRYVFWSLLPAWCIHNFEQHGIDLRGNRFGWAAWANKAAFNCTMGCAFNNETVWMVYGLMVFWSLVGSLLLLSYIPSAAAIHAAIMLANAILPIIAAFVDVKYNPGLMSAVFILLPLSIWALYDLSNVGGATPLAIIIYVIVGLGYQALCIMVLELYGRGHIKKLVLWFLLLAINAIPLEFGLIVKSMECRDFAWRL
eukprot:Platyproteum_vivax@DN4380_c0_g1_i1.p1